MSKSAFLCGASALTLGIVLLAAPAFAADPPNPPASSSPASSPPSTGPAEGGATTIGEVVVVARKRGESLESVPVAITAFGADQREKIGIKTLQDLTDFTPGLAYDSSSNRPSIRGVGRNTDNLTTASAVATYYNGVYYGANPSVALQKDDLFVGTIEVDRGPQNSLHGSNADGGTISYMSQRPTHSFYAEGRVGVSNYDTSMAEAVVSGPINDNLRFRIGATTTDAAGGYYKNLNGSAQGGPIALGANGRDFYGEAQIDANIDKLDIWAMASTGEFWTGRTNGNAVGNLPDNYALNSGFQPNSFYGLCGLPGVAATSNGAGCAGGPAIVPGSVVTSAVTANQFPGNDPGNLSARKFIQEYNSTQNLTHNIALATNLTYHLPGVNLVYIGGYQKFDYNLNTASAYSDAGVESYQLAGPPGAGNLTIYPTPSYTLFGESDESFSHEFNLISTWSSPFQYILGAYIYHERFDQPTDVGVEPNQSQMYHPEYFNLNLIPGVFSLNSGGCGVAASGLLNLCPAPANAVPGWLDTDLKGSYDDYAAFAQGSYKFNADWKVSGAIRYTDDHKSAVQSFRFTQFAVPGVLAALGPLANVVGPSALGAATPNLDVTSLVVAGLANPQKPGAGMGAVAINPNTGFAVVPLDATWSAVTGEADVDWTPNSSTLVYFRYSRGFKSGGFNALGTITANEETQPETVDAFEIGAKKKMGSTLTVNGAAFYYNYYNDQVPLYVQESGAVASTLYNVPLARDYGVELEGTWRPIQALTLSLNYSYLSATIADAGHCVEDSIDPLAQQPGAKTSGCAQIAGSGIVLQNINGQTLPGAARNKISLNALYNISFNSGILTLSGSVIWKDKSYGAVFNRPYDLAPSYATLGLRANWAAADGRYNVIVYCNNVTNTFSWDHADGHLELPATASVAEDILSTRSLNPPRTFGMELQYRFR